MKSIMKTWFALALLLCAGAVFAADGNRRAPGFSLIDSKGTEHDLADYRGRVVMLVFLQTSCPHCGAVADAVQGVQEKYGSRIAVVAVVNPPDDLPKVTDFIAKHHLHFPVLFDSGQMAYSYILGTNMVFPHVYLIDAGGIIRRDVLYGAAPPETFTVEGLSAEINHVLPAGAPEKK